MIWTRRDAWSTWSSLQCVASLCFCHRERHCGLPGHRICSGIGRVVGGGAGAGAPGADFDSVGAPGGAVAEAVVLLALQAPRRFVAAGVFGGGHRRLVNLTPHIPAAQMEHLSMSVIPAAVV
eukprot:scaffold406086_cov51-Prasinocladus_malaysianus.AAC.2